MIYLIAGSPVKCSIHYLQLVTDCNTVRVMIHNGIVKAIEPGMIGAAKFPSAKLIPV
nr:MAG TPA: hypothetical protein [Caudoviricetes sp.]